MENIYDDQMLPDDFQQIAKAYSKHLKDNGFVFIRLQEEEFNLLLSESFVLIAKMQACLKRLAKRLNAKKLEQALLDADSDLQTKFGKHNAHSFVCIENENEAFLSLISLENTLIIKLMLLSVKSGELELCNKNITSICSVFAESFSMEGFKIK